MFFILFCFIGMDCAFALARSTEPKSLSDNVFIILNGVAGMGFLALGIFQGYRLITS